MGPDIAHNVLKEGDEVRVVIKDGRELEFRVVEVNEDALVGENQRIAFSKLSDYKR